MQAVASSHSPSPSISSCFARNATVNEIVESLFIESWITNISFDDYFIECQPSSCAYTIIYRQSITFIITSIMGLYGGLTISLRLSTPIVVNIVRKLVQLRGRTQTAHVPFSVLVVIFRTTKFLPTSPVIFEYFDKPFFALNMNRCSYH
jgi:hypothetical protein